MPKRYECIRSEDSDFMYESDTGEYVLATDYAALEAERDEWKRRCERICNWIDTHNDNGAGEAIYAIAEGRDNG